MTLKPKNNFNEGDFVLVLSLKRNGTILAISGKNIKVSIGDFQINCKSSDLELADKPKTKRLEHRNAQSFQKSKFKCPSSLDLHGFTSIAAKEAIITFISKAVMAGLSEVSVIHGHGAGTIKAVVHDTLSKLEVVASFRHPINNNAETKVYLS